MTNFPKYTYTIITVQFFKSTSVALVTIFSFVTSGYLLVRDMHCQVNEACVCQ